MRRATRALTAASVLAVALVGPAGGAAAGGGDRGQVPPELALSHQSTIVAPDGTFTASVFASGVDGATAVRLAVLDRVRSRSELADVNGGGDGRAALRTTTTPLTEAAAEADGSQRVTISLGGDDPRPVTTPGVYPVEIEALDGSGEVLDRLVTDLVLRPPASEGTPPLAVAVLAEVGTDTGHLPSPDDALGLANALAAVAGVPATLAVGPSFLDDLAASADPADLALLAALRTVAADHPLLALPYVATSPDALAEAGLAAELPHQLDRGAAVLESDLGVRPRETTWLAAPDLGASGLRLLSALGVGGVVVAPGRVERVLDGVLSPARPFLLAPPKEDGRRPTGPDEPVRGLLSDARLADALQADDEPALVAAHAVGELAMLWFEQPGTQRTIVARVDPSVDGAAVQAMLEALRTPELFRAVALDDAFDAAAPLEESSGTSLRRSLSPADADKIPSAVSEGVRQLRSTRASVQGMVGEDHPTLAELDRHLLRATGLDQTAAERRRELARAGGAVSVLADAVSTPEEVTITLTAREGTVPLTIRNDTGGPVSVRLRFSSANLELPGGDTLTLALTDQTTRLDIAVRTRTSGAFPFTVDVTSPDGEVLLASTRYSVRSTAVSGVGLALSLGAGLFLVVWWARHWRQSRRSSKLVGDPSPPT